MSSARWCGQETELYELWLAHAHTGARMRDREGRSIVVVSKGRRNEGAGPDFIDAVLLVAGRLQTGAIEMHRNERDWFLHQHHHDPAYDSVILHVLGRTSKRPLLAIATVEAATIDRTPGREPVEASVGVSRELLVECAWSRLLRRATAIVREDQHLDAGTRIERAFVRRLFDALGYSANRKPMRELAERVIRFTGAGIALSDRILTLDAWAATIFGCAGLDIQTLRTHAKSFVSNRHCDEIIRVAGGVRIALERDSNATEHGSRELRWSRASRPANSPERRLWGAAVLLTEIGCRAKINRLLDGVAAARSWRWLCDEVTVRSGTESFIGIERASEIVMNAVLPTALAAGILGGSSRLIHGACHAYRTAPAQQSNQIIRRFEARHLGGRILTRGFWQQGAIELHQHYFSPDRSGLSFIAERGGALPRWYCVS